MKMNKRLAAYLRSLGLAQDAEDGAAWEFYRSLRGLQASIANALNYAEGDEQARTNCDLMIRSLGYDPANPENQLQRQEPATPEPNAPSAEPTPDQVRAEAAQAERNRIARINDLAGVINGLPSEIRQQAIDSGASVEVAQERFLTWHRENNRMQVPAAGVGPAIHVANSQTSNDRHALVAALMLREGIGDPTRCWPEYDAVIGSCRSRDAGSDAEIGRAVDAGNRLRGYSMIEIARRALALDGINCGPSASEIAYAARSSMAISNLALTGVFTTSFTAIMVAAYEEAGDTTQGWTNERFVPNYLTNERPRMTAFEHLTKRAKGVPAEHTQASDAVETYKVSEYARQLVIDEQDLINDSFSALEEFSPLAMGRAAARLRPDLVYAILLGNPVMRDNVQLFHADHANLKTSATLAVDKLTAARAAIAIQRENTVNLNLAMRYLIVPEQLRGVAETLVESSVVVYGGNTAVPANNPNAKGGLVVVSDARLDNGVVDPNTGTSHSGSAKTWFGAAAGDGHTIEVGYIRELGRNPRVRSKILDEGRFGIAFDVQHSVGAKAIDWRGLVKNTE